MMSLWLVLHLSAMTQAAGVPPQPVDLLPVVAKQGDDTSVFDVEDEEDEDDLAPRPRTKGKAQSSDDGAPGIGGSVLGAGGGGIVGVLFGGVLGFCVGCPGGILSVIVPELVMVVVGSFVVVSCGMCLASSTSGGS